MSGASGLSYAQRRLQARQTTTALLANVQASLPPSFGTALNGNAVASSSRQTLDDDDDSDDDDSCVTALLDSQSSKPSAQVARKRKRKSMLRKKPPTGRQIDHEEHLRKSDRQAQLQQEAQEKRLQEQKLERDRLKADKRLTKQIVCLRSELKTSTADELRRTCMFAMSEGGKVPTMGRRPPSDTTSLVAQVSQIRHRRSSKLMPHAVRALEYHFSSRRSLLFVGDQQGHVGLLASAGHPEDDRSWHWKMHTSAITRLRALPSDERFIISSSTDGTVRRIDLETTSHGLVLDVQDYEEAVDEIGTTRPPPIVAFDVDPTGSIVWALSRTGSLHMRDMRMTSTRTTEWEIGGKLSDVSINPCEPHYLATAQLDSHVRIWDIRSLKSKLKMPQPISWVERARMCGAAIFDESGSTLVTSSASVDNVIQAFDFASVKASSGQDIKPSQLPA
ncbi:hypothetical protein OIO90_000343 [Microbotryomycetes sp. JL221]|nr:hypothetical protein OIO90_000343 [Microbotryomycetes sp. JL221]